MNDGEDYGFFAKGEEPTTTQGVRWGLLTNTGNLRDCLARGSVRPAALRAKHYRDLGDLAPGHVVLARLPVPRTWLDDVTRDDKNPHLKPVILPLREGALRLAVVENEILIAVPGPVPLTAFRCVQFEDEESHKEFKSRARFGEDNLGVPFEAGFELAEPAAAAAAVTLNILNPVICDAALDRLFDARAGVLVTLAAAGMGGLSRHLAARAASNFLAGGRAVPPAAMPPHLSGVWNWLHQTPLSQGGDPVDAVTQWVLGHFHSAGGGIGFAAESFLRAMREDSGSLPVNPEMRKRAEECLESIEQSISFAATESNDSIMKGPFLALQEYLTNIAQYDNGKFPKQSDAPRRLARVMHAVRVGWSGLLTTDVDLAVRRSILESALTALHRGKEGLVPFAAAGPTPPDCEGWLIESASRNEPVVLKFMERKFFDKCWETELTLPEPIEALAQNLKGLTVRIHGRVNMTNVFSTQRLEALLANSDLDLRLRKACETGMKHAPEKPPKTASKRFKR